MELLGKIAHDVFMTKPKSNCWLCSQPPPTLRYPNYRGCLELDTLNEEVVSLYNFQHTFQLDTTAEKPCAR